MAKRTLRESIIRVESVEKSFPLGQNGSRNTDVLEVLRGVTLEIFKGETIAIVGASGAGKSTLLHIIGTLDRPTSGRVTFQEKDVFSLDDEGLSRFRNSNIGFVFQFHHLLPEFSALENVAIPAMIGGMGLPEALKRAGEALGSVGLSDRSDHKPPQLSGGEQQRVAVARALINNPMVVLADEPTGNLDTANAQLIHDLIATLCQEQAQTFVIVTHNEKLAKQADRVVRIVDGRVGTS
jgi:lipoprotein-releasing system ATP-binding protein